MTDKTIIKTDLGVGQFLEKSFIDGRDVRLVDNDDIEKMDQTCFEIVDHSTLISISDFETIYGIKI